MTIESTLSKAAKEVEAGRLWRAKEILASSVSNYGYSRELLYELANVLLKMDDVPQAGKYLLLSVDRPNPKELQAINLFLSRNHNQHYASLLKKFPARARLCRRDDYPEHLRVYLASIGAPESFSAEQPALIVANSSTHDRLFLLGCSILGFSIIVCTIVGAYSIIAWIAGGV